MVDGGKYYLRRGVLKEMSECTCEGLYSFNAGRSTWEVRHDPACPVIGEIVKTAVVVERERCAKEICDGCRRGIPFRTPRCHADGYGYCQAEVFNEPTK